MYFMFCSLVPLMEISVDGIHPRLPIWARSLLLMPSMEISVHGMSPMLKICGTCLIDVPLKPIKPPRFVNADS